MSRRAALWALAYAHSDPSRSPGDLLSHLGALSAWRARRRVVQALARADAALGESAGGDAGHRLRLAFLYAVGRAPAGDQARDRGAVWAAFSAQDTARLLASPPVARGRLLFIVSASLLALALLGLGGFALLQTMFPAPTPHIAPAPPPPPPPADQRIGRAMTDWMIALDGLSATPGALMDRAALSKARAALDRERPALGPDVGRTLGDLLGEGERLIASTGDYEADSAALSQRVRAFNAACDAGGRHYYVDGVLEEEQAGRRRVYLSLFTIEDSHRWASDPAPIRAVRVRRLDRVGFWKTLIGYTSADIPEAVVLLDQADEELLSQLLPVLARSGSFPLVSPDGPHASAPWRAETETALGEALRAELLALPGLDRDSAIALGEVLHAQATLVDRWRRRLEQQGRGLSLSWKYALDLSRLESLREQFPDFGDLEPLQRRLREARLQSAWQVLAAAFLASVERHEVQHRWDFEHPHRDGARAAFARAGVPRANGPEGTALEDRAFDELSAYLAQLASDPLPRATIARLDTVLLEDPGWITAESRAAAVLLPAIDCELGARTPPLVERGEVRPEAVVATLRGLLPRSADELRAAARAAWEHLNRRPLPPLSAP